MLQLRNETNVSLNVRERKTRMKTKFFAILAVFCAVVSYNVVNADVVALSGPWGTAFSDVEEEAYYHKFKGVGDLSGNDLGDGKKQFVTSGSYGNPKTRVLTDTWDYRLSLLKNYLADGLGKNQMDDSSTDATSSNPINYGLLNDVKNSNDIDGSKQKVGYVAASASEQPYESIYGKKAATLLGNVTTSGVEEAMFRTGQSGTILTSFASPTHETVEHNWIYDKVADKFTSDATSIQTGKKDVTGIGDHNTGLFAFVTGFTYDPNATYQYLNGWFSELGNLVGIYVNGVELSGEFIRKSDDYLNSKFFGNFDMEIDLAALFEKGILSVGNNNLAFVIDSILPEYYEGTYYDGNDGLVAFVSGLNMNTESIFNDNPAPTPEPATLLIFGAGLVGLGIRRKLMSKKSV